MIQATLKSCTESQLDGQTADVSFDIIAIEYTFAEDPEAYLIGFNAYTFSASQMTLDPSSAPLTFTYSAIESGTGTLPTDWITLVSPLDFTIETSDQTFPQTKTIEKEATCVETGQVISETFTITFYS